MKNQAIYNRLIELQAESAKLGIEYLRNQTPIDLCDTKKVLKPFADIHSSFNNAIKKLNPIYSIQKQNTSQR